MGIVDWGLGPFPNPHPILNIVLNYLYLLSIN